MRQPHFKWIALCLASAFIFGLMPSFARLAYEDGASVHLVLLGRSIVGFAVLLIYPLYKDKRPDLSAKALASSFPTGCAHAFAAFGILGSIAYIDIALAMVIIFLYPIPIAIVEHLQGKTQLTKPIFGLMVATLFGLALVLGPDFGSINPIGILIAFIGAIATTVMILQMSRVTREKGAVNANLLLTLWAAILFGATALIGPVIGVLDPLRLPQSTYGWTMVAGVGVTFSLGYLFFFLAASHIGATRASLLSIAEPVMMILFAIALLGESVSLLEALGIALVILSLAFSEILRQDLNPRRN